MAFALATEGDVTVNGRDDARSLKRTARLAGLLYFLMSMLMVFGYLYVPAAFIADGLARLQVRYPEVQVVFADARRFAEEWTYRFLAAALSDAKGGDPVAERG